MYFIHICEYSVLHIVFFFFPARKKNIVIIFQQLEHFKAIFLCISPMKHTTFLSQFLTEITSKRQLIIGENMLRASNN